MIKFKVRDNHHVLGVVRLSVNNLPGRRPKPKWESLTAYKKAGEVFGELQIECYVSEFRPGHVLSNSEKSSPLQSRFGSQEDILDVSKKGRFSFHRRTPSSGRPQSGFVPVSEGEGEVDGAVKASKVVDASVSSSDSKEFESSDLKLTKSVRNNPFVPPSTSFTSLTVSSASEAQSVADSRGASPTTSEVLTCPQVTGVSPREGPMEGGQKVVLRGSNLGESRDDILRVTVADVDCTSTLEYISPCKSPPFILSLSYPSLQLLSSLSSVLSSPLSFLRSSSFHSSRFHSMSLSNISDESDAPSKQLDFDLHILVVVGVGMCFWKQTGFMYCFVLIAFLKVRIPRIVFVFFCVCVCVCVQIILSHACKQGVTDFLLFLLTRP